MNEQPMLTQKQAAERLHIGRWALRDLNLPRIQPSPRTIRYAVDVIEAHLAASQRGQVKAP